MAGPVLPLPGSAMRLSFAMLVCALVLAACPQDEPKSKPKPSGLNPLLVIGPLGGSADPDGGTAVGLMVSGQVTFDRLPVTAGGLGSTPTTAPAVNVLIEAVRHNDMFDVVATTTTDASGNYTMNLLLTHDFYMRARTITGTGTGIDRVYHNQTSTPVLHAAVGPILNRATGNQTANLHADTTLGMNRGGAFSILDSVRRLRAAAAGSYPNLGPLDVYWSVGGNLVTDTDPDGPNSRPTIRLAGGSSADPANTDHDEFDETVIAHEWASFLQLTQSRDNNFGGPHAGEELVFSASYSEGVVTAIGCALLGIQTYRDTTGYPGGATSVQFEFDCESGVLPGAGMGYGSEFRVTRVVWDLIDGGLGGPADFDADPVAIAMSDFFASFDAMAARSAPYEVAWLAGLLQQLIDDAFLSQVHADTLMQSQGAQFPPAGGADPFPSALVIGAGTASGSLDAWSGVTPNPILGPQANAVFRLEVATAQTVTVTLINTTVGYVGGSHRTDLTIWDLSRNAVAAETGTGVTKVASMGLAAGTYIVRVQHLPQTQAQSAPATFTIEAQ